MNKINVVVKHPIVVQQLYLKLLYLLMLLELFVDVLINFVVPVLYHPCNVDAVDKNYVEVAVAVAAAAVDFVLLLKAVIIVVVLFGVLLFHILLVKYIYHQL